MGTTPNQARPDGAFAIEDPGDTQYGSVGLTESTVQALTMGGVRQSFVDAEEEHDTQVKARIDNVYTISITADGKADDAVSQAEAAANAAAAATEVADNAYENASYWEAECVVASAEVLNGVNELLIGLCQNVPTGKVREISDIHIALQSQVNGMTIQTKKWDATGTTSSVIHTATLGANVTRINYNNLGIAVADKERIFWNVSSITGSTAPQVLQILVFGAITDAP